MSTDSLILHRPVSSEDINLFCYIYAGDQYYNSGFIRI